MKSLERKILANQFHDQIEAILADNGFSTRSVFDYNDLCGLMAAGIASERDRCLDCQPSTAENPNEDAYQRGRFDGIMEFARAIAQPTTSEATKLRRSKALDELGALDGELLP